MRLRAKTREPCVSPKSTWTITRRLQRGLVSVAFPRFSSFQTVELKETVVGVTSKQNLLSKVAALAG